MFNTQVSLNLPEFNHLVLEKNNLKCLVKSIKKSGQLVPIQLMWTEDKESHFIIYGRHRIGACHILGHSTIKAIIMEYDKSKLPSIHNFKNPIHKIRIYRPATDTYITCKIPDSLSIGRKLSRNLLNKYCKIKYPGWLWQLAW
jgi:ParB-like nuclease domain